MATPMQLILPTVGVTPETTWADLLNAALANIEYHDHTPTKGLLLTQASINITNSFNMNRFGIVNTREIVFRDDFPSSNYSLYCTGGDLHYIDKNGNDVRITASGAVNVSGLGNISGMGGTSAAATYSDLNKQFSFTQSSGIGAIGAFSYVKISHPSSSQNSITLKALSGSNAYDFVFPASLPTNSLVNAMCIDSAGQNYYIPVSENALDYNTIALRNNSGNIRAVGFYATVVSGTDVQADTMTVATAASIKSLAVEGISASVGASLKKVKLGNDAIFGKASNPYVQMVTLTALVGATINTTIKFSDIIPGGLTRARILSVAGTLSSAFSGISYLAPAYIIASRYTFITITDDNIIITRSGFPDIDQYDTYTLLVTFKD